MSNLIRKTEHDLDDLINYVNLCKINEGNLYDKLVNTFNDLGALFNNFIKDPNSENDKYKNACVSLCNAFKHQKEINYDYKNLRIIEYGTTINCILDAPFGDVVYFKNSDILKKLSDPRNYEWYFKMFEGKRLDIILLKIKEIVGDINE